MAAVIITTRILFVRGCDKIVPVDIYVPGCPHPPRLCFMVFFSFRKKLEEKVVKKDKILNATNRFKSNC